MSKKNSKHENKLDTFITAVIVTFYLAAFMTTLYLPPEAIFYSITAVDFIHYVASRLHGYYDRSRHRSKRDR